MERQQTERIPKRWAFTRGSTGVHAFVADKPHVWAKLIPCPYKNVLDLWEDLSNCNCDNCREENGTHVKER